MPKPESSRSPDRTIGHTWVRWNPSRAFFLPALEPPRAPVTEYGSVMTTDTTSSGSRPATILLVEDDGPLRRIMLRVLEEEGYAACSARTGAEVITLFTRRRNAIDLVVSGVLMAALDGLDLYHAVRRLHPSVPILFVSGYAAPELTREIAHDAKARLLLNPWTVEELLREVRTSLS